MKRKKYIKCSAYDHDEARAAGSTKWQAKQAGKDHAVTTHANAETTKKEAAAAAKKEAAATAATKKEAATEKKAPRMKSPAQVFEL